MIVGRRADGAPRRTRHDEASDTLRSLHAPQSAETWVKLEVGGWRLEAGYW